MIRLMCLIFSLILVQELSSQVFWKTEFTPNSTNFGQNFGRMINCNDSILLISSNHDNSFGQNSGSLYYYRKNKNQWRFKNQVYPNDIGPNKAFGYFFWYDTILYVRSSKEIWPAVYEFRLDSASWKQTARISLPLDSLILGNGIGFGYGLCRFDKRLFISAPYFARYLDNAGIVYEFRKENGNYFFHRSLLPPNPSSGANLGIVIVTDTIHKSLIISAPSDSSAHGISAGSVSIFSLQSTQLELQQIMYPPEYDVNQGFGVSICLAGEYLFIDAALLHELCPFRKNLENNVNCFYFPLQIVVIPPYIP